MKPDLHPASAKSHNPCVHLCEVTCPLVFAYSRTPGIIRTKTTAARASERATIPSKSPVPYRSREGKKFFPHVRGAMPVVLSSIFESSSHLTLHISLRSAFKQIIDRAVYSFQTHHRGRTLRDYENK